ncbi:hypothetical protein U0070_018235, partial [Myodes glareolus]
MPLHSYLSGSQVLSICTFGSPFLFTSSFLGNCTIFCVIRTEPSLHESDLGLSFSSIPMMFNSMGISAAVKVYIHGFTDMESSLLLIVPFVCSVALWHPLKYSSVLTSSRVVHTGLVSTVKSILLVLPFPLTLRRLRYCRMHLLTHSCSPHQDVMQLACSDNRDNFYYGLFVPLCVMSDHTVLGIALHGEWLEALNTCVSHICAVLIFYVTISTLAAMHRFVNHKAPLGIILIADAFLLVPPLMNPIVKTHQIRVKALEKLSHDILRSSIFST